MNTYMSYITDELKSLTSIPSPSGFTKEVTAYVHKVLTDMGYEPYFSNKGNVHVTLGGEGHPLLLAAHLDTLGAMVRSIKNNGRLRPTTLGGHQWTTCDGENCTVHTRDGKVYTGVVLNTEPSAHVADEKAERKEENMEILLDENVDTKEATKALGIQVGDIIAMDPRTTVTESGYIKSRFLDDKLSAAILLGLAKMVKEEHLQLNRKVSLLFTVYEEVGHGGCFIPEDTEEMLSVDMGCGGGGIPVLEQKTELKGASAVIEKDYTAGRLAELLNADELMILTSVEKVAVGYHTENETLLGEITVETAKEYMEQKQFEENTMLPKVEASVEFVEKGQGRRAVITSIDKAVEGYLGKTGTVITK